MHRTGLHRLSEHSKTHEDFAAALVASFAEQSKHFQAHPGAPDRLLIKGKRGERLSLNLTPFKCTPQPVTATAFFTEVGNMKELITGYYGAKTSGVFEESLCNQRIHPYAERFLEELLERAQRVLTDQDARTVANFVKDLDLYTAVKTVECLLDNRANLALFSVARQKGWSLHFDHLAIRCGSSMHKDAEAVVDLLKKNHGYVAPQVPGERCYSFTDGWNAYLLYKMLDNGQVLRLFIDQSDVHHSNQIIQHWNRVYGYTAHHLAVRATRAVEGTRRAVPLAEFMNALKEEGVETMEPTGAYTQGLLLQVFTRPTASLRIPSTLRQELREIEPGLEDSIRNGKLLELVSRREMPTGFAERFHGLYDLQHDPREALHSTPTYHYFLPDQAAHVIRTSLQPI